MEPSGIRFLGAQKAGIWVGIGTLLGFRVFGLVLKSSGLGVRGWDYSSLGQVLGFAEKF